MPRKSKSVSDCKTDEDNMPQISSRKKLVKKNFQVVASVGPNGIQGNLMSEVRKPLIAHLQIASKEIVTFDTNTLYDPNPPPAIQAFNPDEIDIFSEAPHLLTEPSTGVSIKEDAYNNKLTNDDTTIIENEIKKKDNNKNTPQIQSGQDFYKKSCTLLVQFKDTDEKKQLPEKTDIACLWCCHQFDNRPCIIPYRDIGSHLIVYGNFCSPECSMAYLFEQRIDAHTRWEQLSLLNRVYGEMVNGRIYVAPSRLSLKLFGGPLSIEEYRNLLRSRKYRIDIHQPPMVSILSTMDTKPIDFYDANNNKSVLETVQERVAKAEEVLRLKRSKPLKAWENTLDACMNIRVGPIHT